MALDQQLINDVLAHIDIVEVISSYIKVIKKGRSYVAICPFHSDKNPSLQISKEKQIFKCFVCQKGGNAIRFIELYEKISFFEAMKKASEICGYKDSRLETNNKKIVVDDVLSPLKKCLSDLTSYYELALTTEEGIAGQNYFESRKLDFSFRRKYRLGYAFEDGKQTIRFLQNKGHSLKTIELAGISNGDNGIYSDRNSGRVIFPLIDQNGVVVGYSARKIKNDDSAKYVNSPETKLFHKSSILYNFNHAKETARIDGFVYVLEGFMDVFALDKIGINSSVALMGTSLTEEHIKLLRFLNVEVRICLDGDKPGQDAMMKILGILKNTGLSYRFVDNGGSSKDPDEILQTEGEEKLRSYLNNLISPLDFALSYYQTTNPLTSLEERKKLIYQFIPILLSVRSSLEFDSYVRKLSSITKFEVESIKELIKKSRYRDDNNEVFSSFHPERKVLRRFQLAEKELLFQMLHHSKAIDFYEKNVEAFYDELYRKIADYLLINYEKNKSIQFTDLISFIESSEDPKSEELINEVTSILFEKNHPQDCDDSFLNEILATINSEKEKMYFKSVLDKAMEGKSELEKARIIADYNKHNIKKED